MDLLTDIRYWLALVVLLTWLPAIGCWLVIHPLVEFWRKAGVFAMWISLLVLIGSAGYGLFYFRDAILGADLGAPYLTAVPGVLLLVLGFALDFERRRTLTTRILVGTPEVKNENTTLLTGGPYARVRHPRYLAIFLAYLGFALLANFAGLYIYYALSVPVLYLVILLEEKELRARFGQAYDNYARKTPRLIPKIF